MSKSNCCVICGLSIEAPKSIYPKQNNRVKTNFRRKPNRRALDYDYRHAECTEDNPTDFRAVKIAKALYRIVNAEILGKWGST